MNREEYLLLETELPKPLEKEEIKYLFENYKTGDMEARDKIIVHNIKLVLYIVKQNFYDTRLNETDLVSLGLIGLINAVDTYDTSKEIEFTTYAYKCIYYEILKSVKKELRREETFSIDYQDVKNSYKVVKQSSINNIEMRDNEMHKQLIIEATKKIVDDLDEIDRDIIESYFGLNGKERILQRVLGEKYQKTASYITKRIQKITSAIKFELQLQELLDYDINVEEMIENKLPKNLYDLFPAFTMQEINFVIHKLSKEHIALLKKRHGKDFLTLSNDFIWENREEKEQYLRLINVIKVQLKSIFSKSKTIQMDLNVFTSQDKNLLNKTMNSEYIYARYKGLSQQEIEIGLLKTGAINGKYFSIDFISKLYNIDPDNVKRIVIKFLNTVKNNLMSEYSTTPKSLIS